MWQTAESKTRPERVDSTSSRKWVYIRRNIHTEERTDEQGESETFYVYEEQKIPKDVYSVFEQENQNGDRISDIEDVLAEIIGGDL